MALGYRLRTYFASKASPEYTATWRRIRNELADICSITSHWIDLDEEPKTEKGWRELWTQCATKAGRCDVLLAVLKSTETHKGALVEIGAALSSNHAQVLIVADADVKMDFFHHPSVALFRTLPEAVDAIRKLAKKRVMKVSAKSSSKLERNKKRQLKYA